MGDRLLPTQYYLEVYEKSFANDPSFYLQSSTPFGAISIGEYYNHRNIDTWMDRPITEKEKFIIKQVEHIFWKIENSHNGHKVMVLLEKVPYEW